MESYKTAILDKRRQMIVFKFPVQDNYIFTKVLNIPNIVITYQQWECPVSKIAIEKLKGLGFELSDSLLNWEPGKQEEFPEIKIENLCPGLTLYPYQKIGVSFLQSKNGRALIADEMGLGKTVQALAWCNLNPDNKPIIIVCPSSLKINWERETKKWVQGANIEILEGKTTYLIPKSKNVYVVNYDILDCWIGELRKVKFKTLILDEAHYIKNSVSKRAKAVKKINRSIPHLIALTGTPIENNPAEIYNIVQVIDNVIFSNYMDFIRRFCGAKKTRFGWDLNGATNTKELNDILKSTIMIRRKKAEVLTELPPKQIVKIPVSITNWNEYSKAEKEFIQFLRERYSNIDEEIEKELKEFAKNNDIEVGEELSSNEIELLKQHKLIKVSLAPFLVQIEYLKQLAVEGKMNELLNWVDDFLETEEKLVMFGIHKKFINQLEKRYPGSVKIDGSVSIKDRQKAVDTFQNDKKCKLFIGNIKAAGVGITLTAASNVLVFEYPWSPSVLTQAIDRLHRISQTKQVMAYHIVGVNTIEERIINILERKQKVIEQVLDGASTQDKSALHELIQSYMK